MSTKQNIPATKFLQVAGLAASLFLLTYLTGLTGIRFDLTKDQRYTLSDAATSTLDNFDQPIYVDVFLEGDLPPDFRRLSEETRQILREFKSKNSNVQVSFIDPMDEDQEEIIKSLQAMGMQPATVTTGEANKISQEMVFPWALVNYGQKTVKVQLLKSNLGATPEENINNSVQHLEYAFADAFTKVGITDKKKIAILKGNGELEDIRIADFLNALKDYYQIAPFTLDSVGSNPEATLEQLKNYDLTLIAKPTESFSNAEKLILDQYLLNGGKGLWLFDQVQMEMDSLYSNRGEAIAIPRDLNLDDMLFKYGVRINPALVSDLSWTPIVLATGSGNQSQFNPAPWLFNPMVIPHNTHPLNTNVGAVRMQFTNPIDTLDNGLSKTVLLESSPKSKSVGTPAMISLNMVNQAPDESSYNSGGMPLAVLLEGEFTSVYNNRVLPVELKNFMAKGQSTGLIIISDGDMIRNDIQNGMPLELGYDKWTSSFYGNKEFLMNCVNYLLEENGLINIRSKKVEIAFLDGQRSFREKSRWQLINIGIPALLSVLSGLVFMWWRRRSYAR